MSRYAPAYISCVCRALPDMEASIKDKRAYTSLPVEIVETHSCRSDCWSMLFGISQPWACHCCHMSSDRLSVGSCLTAVIGRCFEGLHNVRILACAERKDSSLGEGRGVVEYDSRCLYLV